MAGIFEGAIARKSADALLTTYARARRNGPGMDMFRQAAAHPNLTADGLLREKLGLAARHAAREISDAMACPDKTTIDALRAKALEINSLPDGSIMPLGPRDYFALTDTTPHLTPGGKWDQDQAMVHGPDELALLVDEGAAAFRDNILFPGSSSVGVAMPAAGAASRAAAVFSERPDLVEALRVRGGLEGINQAELPPRFSYPVSASWAATSGGAISLLGSMLNSSDVIGKELGAMISTILMLNPGFSSFVVDRFERELSGFSDEQRENVLLFPQTMAQRYYVSDQTPLPGLFPTGHGEFPHLLAKWGVFNHLVESGVKYLFMSNADEVAYSPNPILLGVAKRLIEKGYSAVVFVVPNTNGQKGGGPFKETKNPANQFLVENPLLTRDISKRLKEDPGFTLPVNTLSLVASTSALARVQSNLLNVQAALDLKPTASRSGSGSELMAGLESWMGCELTNPARKPSDYRTAFVFAPRAGFFMGVKTPQHVYGEQAKFLRPGRSDSDFPDELRNPGMKALEPFNGWSYKQYIAYMVENYPTILRRMIWRDHATLEAIYNAGGGYLIPV